MTMIHIYNDSLPERGWEHSQTEIFKGSGFSQKPEK